MQNRTMFDRLDSFVAENVLDPVLRFIDLVFPPGGIR
jgi:hypothetical protein